MKISTCKAAVAAFADYAVTPQSEAAQHPAMSHVRRCPKCAEFLHSYLRTPSIVRRSLGTPVPEGVESRLRTKLLDVAD
jgi:hypothetical protein